MNTWILTKILNYLAQREGIKFKRDAESNRAIVEDVFGYRYEVIVKTLGRSQTHTEALREGSVHV